MCRVLPRQALAHDDLAVGLKCGRKERKPLNVVPVAVGQQHGERIGDLHEPFPERADARAGIENEVAPVGELNMHTRRIAAIARGRGTW